MERTEALQKEVAEQRKRNEARYRAALAGSKYTSLLKFRQLYQVSDY